MPGFRTKRTILAVCFVALAGFTHAGIAQENEPRRLALIVGNQGYQHAGPLSNPVNDAKDLSEALGQLDFEVSLYTDLDADSFDRAFEEYAIRLSETQGVGLFYYAGHGVQLDGDNFLVMTDARFSTRKDLERKSKSVGRILSKLKEAKNELNILILDACRNNPFTAQALNDSRGVTMGTTARGLGAITTGADFGTDILIAYATAPGKVALDGEGDNGLYTKHLLRAITVADQTLERVFKRVRTAVQKDSNGVQIPWETSSLTEDFYFSRTDTGSDTDEPKSNQKPVIFGTF